ncbi:MAG: OmpA family protein, partial [Actinomycetota bacterium]|nr:OmpA family protein [Actinomycetota bacterium]
MSKSAAGSDDVLYTVTLHVGAVPTENMRLTMILPTGVIYQRNSSSRDGVALSDPEGMEGILNYRLGDSPADWTGKISFKGSVAPDLKNDELMTKALLTFNSSEEKNKRTPIVENLLKQKKFEERSSNPEIILHPLFTEFGYELLETDKNVLDGIIADLKDMKVTHVFVTGHTNSTRIAPRSQHLIADNYELSQARAKSVAEYLQAGLNLLPEQMTIDGKGPDEPIASNKTAQGRALNRRVELKISS